MPSHTTQEEDEHKPSDLVVEEMEENTEREERLAESIPEEDSVRPNDEGSKLSKSDVEDVDIDLEQAISETGVSETVLEEAEIAVDPPDVTDDVKEATPTSTAESCISPSVDEDEIVVPAGTTAETKPESVQIFYDPERADGCSDQEFPKAFYCPVSKVIMNDPVVAPDGKSYERSAILATNDYVESQLYSNRSLHAIIVETLETAGDSLNAGILRWQKSMKQGIVQLLEKTPIPTEEYRPLPDAYYCPITYDLMHVPMIDPEGNTFEQVAIENWIRVHKNSPITRKALDVSQLYPNKAISDLLEHEKSKPEDQMHPSVLQWKSEPPPVMPDIPDPTDPLSNPSLAILQQTSGPFPATMEELEFRRMMRQRLTVCTLLGIGCLILAITAAFLDDGGSFIFVSIWVGCCVRDSLRRLYQVRLEERELDRIVEAHSEREEQLRRAQIEHFARIQELQNDLEEQQRSLQQRREELMALTNNRQADIAGNEANETVPDAAAAATQNAEEEQPEPSEAPIAANQSQATPPPSLEARREELVALTNQRDNRVQQLRNPNAASTDSLPNTD